MFRNKIPEALKPSRLCNQGEEWPTSRSRLNPAKLNPRLQRAEHVWKHFQISYQSLALFGGPRL
jgi:hypothetical protein